MFIPTWASKGLKAILFNLDSGQKRENAITHDLGEHFASGPMPGKLIESSLFVVQNGISGGFHKPRKIISKRWTSDEDGCSRKEMAA